MQIFGEKKTQDSESAYVLLFFSTGRTTPKPTIIIILYNTNTHGKKREPKS